MVKGVDGLLLLSTRVLYFCNNVVDSSVAIKGKNCSANLNKEARKSDDFLYKMTF